MDIPLDHNFPEPILNNVREFITEVNLIPLRRIDDRLPEIDDRLPELDDRRLLIAIHQLGFPGIVTNYYKMLQNPRELAAVIATEICVFAIEICVFAIEGVGHDPIRATGALLLDLPSAVRGMEAGRRGVFWLRPRSPRPQDPNELFNRAAQRRYESPKELFDQVLVTAEELSAVDGPRPALASIVMLDSRPTRVVSAFLPYTVATCHIAVNMFTLTLRECGNAK